MQNPLRRLSLVVLAAALLIVSGCASRQYVKHQIGTVEPQIAEVRDLQAQQAERIDAVDRQAQEGLAAADRAAITAQTATERAAGAERLADAAQQNAQRAWDRIDGVEREVELRFANLDKYMLADQTTIHFGFDSDELSAEAMSRLDDLAGQFAGTRYAIELQGFTDSIGSEKYNFGLSERRAGAVLRYLVSKDVPLHRISIVGLGKANPVADNGTARGRVQNRRVEIRVLQASGEVSTATR